MPKQIILLEKIASLEFLLNGPQSFLCILSGVNLIIVTGFEIGSKNTFRVEGFVARKNLQGNVEILHFIVAESNVNVYCFVFPAFEQKFLIDLCCLFVVSSEVMNGGECELILRTLIKLLMVVHEVLFVVFLVGEMEKESGLQGRL